MLFLEIWILIVGLRVSLAGLRKGGPESRIWRPAALCMSMMILGVLTTATYGAIRPGQVPSPSIADLFFLTGYAAGAVWCFRMSFSRRSQTHEWRFAMDSALATASLLFVSWAFVMHPLIEMHGLSSLAALVLFAYPVFDLFVLTTAFISLVFSRSAPAAALRVGAPGLMMLSVLDQVVVMQGPGAVWGSRAFQPVRGGRPLLCSWLEIDVDSVC